MRDTGPVQRTWNRLVVFVIAYPCAKHGIASLRSYKRTIKRFVECRPSGTRARAYSSKVFLPPPLGDRDGYAYIFVSLFVLFYCFFSPVSHSSESQIFHRVSRHHVIIKMIEFSGWRVQGDVSNWQPIQEEPSSSLGKMEEQHGDRS